MLLTVLAFTFIVYASALAPLKLGTHTNEVIKDSYVVVFKPETELAQLASDLSFFEQVHNISHKHTYQHTVKGFAATLSKTQLLHVRSHPRVQFVEQNQIYRPTQGCNQRSGARWGLTRVSQRDLDLDSSYNCDQRAGQGVDVYVIDTGIRITHKEFDGRAIFGFKAESSWTNTDSNGHGTHVASSAGGQFFGVAQGVTLIAVKVLGDDGSGSTAGVIAGVEFAVTNKKSRKRPSVGNMSLGGGFSSALNKAVNTASLSGVIMVVAAGNENQDACLVSPAGADDVISVGATELGEEFRKQEDFRSYFSNFGKCVDIFAPGSAIEGAWFNGDSAVKTISGTSMASPHVAGAAALYLAQNPTASFATVKAALASKATPQKVVMNCAGSKACEASPNLLLYVGCAN